MTRNDPRSVLPRDSIGALNMPRRESPQEPHGERIGVTTSPTSRSGTLTFEGDYATLTFERRIRHPVKLVWEAITEPEHLARWYLTKARVEAREGGSIEYLTGPAQVRVTGKILIWEPPRVFEHEWNVEPRKDLPTGEKTIVRWELPRRRRHAPPFHPSATHAPGRGCLCRRHARFPRPPREPTRRCAARGLGHSDQRSSHELSAVGDVKATALRLYEVVSDSSGRARPRSRHRPAGE